MPIRWIVTIPPKSHVKVPPYFLRLILCLCVERPQWRLTVHSLLKDLLPEGELGVEDSVHLRAVWSDYRGAPGLSNYDDFVGTILDREVLDVVAIRPADPVLDVVASHSIFVQPTGHDKSEGGGGLATPFIMRRNKSSDGGSLANSWLNSSVTSVMNSCGIHNIDDSFALTEGNEEEYDDEDEYDENEDIIKTSLETKQSMLLVTSTHLANEESRKNVLPSSPSDSIPWDEKNSSMMSVSKGFEDNVPMIEFQRTHIEHKGDGEPLAWRPSSHSINMERIDGVGKAGMRTEDVGVGFLSKNSEDKEREDARDSMPWDEFRQLIVNPFVEDPLVGSERDVDPEQVTAESSIPTVGLSSREKLLSAKVQHSDFDPIWKNEVDDMLADLEASIGSQTGFNEKFEPGGKDYEAEEIPSHKNQPLLGLEVIKTENDISDYEEVEEMLVDLEACVVETEALQIFNAKEKKAEGNRSSSVSSYNEDVSSEGTTAQQEFEDYLLTIRSVSSEETYDDSMTYTKNLMQHDHLPLFSDSTTKTGGHKGSSTLKSVNLSLHRTSSRIATMLPPAISKGSTQTSFRSKKNKLKRPPGLLSPALYDLVKTENYAHVSFRAGTRPWEAEFTNETNGNSALHMLCGWGQTRTVDKDKRTVDARKGEEDHRVAVVRSILAIALAAPQMIFHRNRNGSTPVHLLCEWGLPASSGHFDGGSVEAALKFLISVTTMATQSENEESFVSKLMKVKKTMKSRRFKMKRVGFWPRGTVGGKASYAAFQSEESFTPSTVASEFTTPPSKLEPPSGLVSQIKTDAVVPVRSPLSTLDDDGCLPLHLALLQRRHPPSVIAILLQHDPRPEESIITEDAAGTTPLGIFCESHSEEVKALLVEVQKQIQKIPSHNNDYGAQKGALPLLDFVDPSLCPVWEKAEMLLLMGHYCHPFANKELIEESPEDAEASSLHAATALYVSGFLVPGRCGLDIFYLALCFYRDQATVVDCNGQTPIHVALASLSSPHHLQQDRSRYDSVVVKEKRRVRAVRATLVIRALLDVDPNCKHMTDRDRRLPLDLALERARAADVVGAFTKEEERLLDLLVVTQPTAHSCWEDENSSLP